MLYDSLNAAMMFASLWQKMYYHEADLVMPPNDLENPVAVPVS